MKIMFVGLGSIGQRHLQNAKKIFKRAKFFAYRVKKTKNVIINTKLIKKDNFRNYYKINEIYNFHDAKKIKPDITFICNPSSLHLDTAIKFAKIGSHIFIEKPLGYNKKKISILKKNLKKKKLTSMIGFQTRFHPAIIYLKKIIKNKKYGKVKYANFKNLTYLPNHHPYENYSLSYASVKKLGGGALPCLIHEIDLISYFFGNPIKVESISSNSNLIKTEADNNFAALLHYKKNDNLFNVYVKLSLTDVSEKRYFTIEFEKKTIQMDLNNNKLTIYSNKKNQIKRKFNISRNKLFELELIHFKKCILKNKDPVTSVFKNQPTNELFNKCLN